MTAFRSEIRNRVIYGLRKAGTGCGENIFPGRPQHLDDLEDLVAERGTAAVVYTDDDNADGDPTDGDEREYVHVTDLVVEVFVSRDDAEKAGEPWGCPDPLSAAEAVEAEVRAALGNPWAFFELNGDHDCIEDIYWTRTLTGVDEMGRRPMGAAAIFYSVRWRERVPEVGPEDGPLVDLERIHTEWDIGAPDGALLTTDTELP